MSEVQTINIIADAEGELRVSSLIIAGRTEVEHRAILQLVRIHLAEFEEFGGVAFEMQPFETAGGTQRREVALLNEQQATLLVTFMRNSQIVREFKVELVKQFYEMRQALSSPALPSTRQLAEMVIAAEDAKEVAELRAISEKSRADATQKKLDSFENSHGLKVTRFVQKYFPDYSRDQIFAFFYDSKQWLVNNPQGRWSANQKRYIPGADHQQPKNGGGRYFHMPEEPDYNGKPRFTLRVRRDTEHELVAELERHGFRPVLASQFSDDIIPAT